jgi:sulfur-carrier protein adenylyltransferase/sulfurtransferase
VNAEEKQRYARHLSLAGFGDAAQEKLKAARVLIIGAGGLGSPAALYLAAAGVGTLGLADDDVVDVSNLQRQVLFGTRDVGAPKLEAARGRLADINPHVEIVLHPTRVNGTNVLALIRDYDVVIDATDNFATRYAINDACVSADKPNVYASVHGFEAQLAVFTGAPCYRCLYPEPPPAGAVASCAEGGVLGVVPGFLGTLQASEAIKLIARIGTPLVGKLLHTDLLTMTFRTLTIKARSECQACGPARKRSIFRW